VKRDIGQFSECCPKVKKDLMDLQQELAKLKEEMRATRSKTDQLAPPAANAADSPTPPQAAAWAQKSSSSPPSPELAPRPPKPSPVKISPPPALPKQAKQFPPSVKKGNTWRGEIDVPEGIIAHLTRKCGGNVHDRHVVDVTSGSFEKETAGVNPNSGSYDNFPHNAAKNARDLETVSYLHPIYPRS
jgi:hypothetical protein